MIYTFLFHTLLDLHSKIDVKLGHPLLYDHNSILFIQFNAKQPNIIIVIYLYTCEFKESGGSTESYN